MDIIARHYIYRDVVAGVLAHLRAGESFSQALGTFPDQFPPLFIESVRASEQTGDVTWPMRRYIEYEEWLDTLKNHVLAASVYPALLVATGLLVLLFMLGYVVPRLAGAYENVQGQAPALSRLLFAWGKVVNAHGMGVAAGGAVLLLAVARSLVDGSARAALLRGCERLPVLGEQIRIYHLARLYRTIIRL